MKNQKLRLTKKIVILISFVLIIVNVHAIVQDPFITNLITEPTQPVQPSTPNTFTLKNKVFANPKDLSNLFTKSGSTRSLDRRKLQLARLRRACLERN